MSFPINNFIIAQHYLTLNILTYNNLLYLWFRCRLALSLNSFSPFFFFFWVMNRIVSLTDIWLIHNIWILDSKNARSHAPCDSHHQAIGATAILLPSSHQLITIHMPPMSVIHYICVKTVLPQPYCRPATNWSPSMCLGCQSSVIYATRHASSISKFYEKKKIK